MLTLHLASNSASKILVKNKLLVSTSLSSVLVFVSLYLCQLLIEGGKSLESPHANNFVVDLIDLKAGPDQKERPIPPIKEHKNTLDNIPLDTPRFPMDKIFENTNNIATSGLELPSIKMNGLVSGDGPYFPRFKMPPIYPLRARNLGIEGSCLVEYTITPSGTVIDVRAIQGKCKNIFKKSSIDAAKKFLYRPMIVNGSPKRVENVRNRFIFELQSDE